MEKARKTMCRPGYVRPRDLVLTRNPRKKFLLSSREIKMTGRLRYATGTWIAGLELAGFVG